MLVTLKNNQSLTFYQKPPGERSGKLSSAYTGGVASTAMADTALRTATTTGAFNEQLFHYLCFCKQAERDAVSKTAKFIQDVRKVSPAPTAKMLRDTNTWEYNVKKLVTREELMKLQISGETDLPLSPAELNVLKAAIKNCDLAKVSDKEVKEIVESIRNQQDYLNALKEFKNTGKISDLLRSDPEKLKALKEVLQDIDLSKITDTDKQLKKLIDNYCEKTEFHHRESISSDPDKQSVTDNIEPLKTSAHNARHKDPASGKVNYKKPVKDKLLDRKQDMRTGNNRRVLRNELQGLGIAVALGMGLGFTIGVVTTLASSGITPDSLRLAAIEGSKSGLESGLLSGIGYGIGRTIGEVATRATSGALTRLGFTITDNMTKMLNMGTVGVLTIVVFSTYQFVKLKIKGEDTKAALIQVGRQALFSLSLLAVSIAAQGIWGGAAGIIVSVSVGILIIAYSAGDAVHQRHLSEKIRIFAIEQCYPAFAA